MSRAISGGGVVGGAVVLIGSGDAEGSLVVVGAAVEVGSVVEDGFAGDVGVFNASVCAAEPQAVVINMHANMYTLIRD